MYGDNTEALDDFRMKNGGAGPFGPSEHSQNDKEVVVIRQLD